MQRLPPSFYMIHLWRVNQPINHSELCIRFQPAQRFTASADV
ncbi:peptide ABC transporter permease [Salmonella enterica subsp. enterica serovar Poona]|nr:peptide ABC transporter permease [Salmonella enterica subsp. enterica serovar Poona]